MSLSNSRVAYHDCYDLLDRALEETRGVHVTVNSINAAQYLRMRIHHARTIDRRENRATYADPDHPLHDRSPYDILVCRIDGDETWGQLSLDKQKVDILSIEPIPVDERIEYRPMKMIEGPKPAAVQEVLPPLPKAATGIRRR